MTKFVQHINANMTTPQSLPDTPTFHAIKPDWGNVVGEAFEGAGNIVNSLGDIKKAEEKAMAATRQAEAEAAETREGNNYARELQNLVSKREQNNNRTQFEQSVRMLNDVYLSRGILKADKLAAIRNSYDSGYLSLNENSRERWAKYDDEATNKIIEEMQSKHSHLKGKKRSDVLRDYNRITNNLDFAIEIQNRMNTIDPAQYPEEHQRLKEQRDSFFENNVVGQVLEAIADDLNSNNEYFKDPVKVEEYKQSIIAFLTRNKVAIDDAAIIAETAFTKTGAYSVYDNEKNILGISKQNMSDIIDYRKTQANYAIDQQLPELVVLSQLVNNMSPEVYKAFSNLPEGRKINDTIAANYASAAKGITNFNIDFGDKSKAISIAQDLQRTTAPSLLKGSSMVASAQAVNNVPSIKEISSRDFDTVISNARGVAAIFDNPHTQATKRQLQSSNKPTEQALGIQMDNEERRAKALASVGTYLQSAHKGAQNLRYIMDNSTVFNNLRVNNAGKIVFVPGTSVAGAIEEGIAEQFAGYGQMIDEINADVAAVTGLSGQGLADFWRAINIPTLSEGERPQHAPAFNWTSKPVEDLSETEENFTSEETRAESRELNKDLFEPVTYSASTKSSEPLAFASLAPVEKNVEEHIENLPGVLGMGARKEWDKYSTRLEKLLEKNKDIFKDVHIDNFKLPLSERYIEGGGKDAIEYIQELEDKVKQVKEFNKGDKSAQAVIDEYGNINMTATASSHTSTTLSNPHIDMPESYDGPLPESMRQELNAALATKDRDEAVADLEEKIEALESSIEKLKKVEGYEAMLNRELLDGHLRYYRTQLYNLTHEDMLIDQE